MWTADELVRAHAHCNQNREALTLSARCGCFYCLAVYNPLEITRWVDPPNIDTWSGPEDGTGRTALCARCGINAVLAEAAGYPLTEVFLDTMHNRWFQ